jgi:peptidoglycan/LPS O-acetylase OafA/YrhL
MDVVLVVFAALVALAFVIVQVWSLARWRGGWRTAALLPLIGFGFVAVRIVFDTRRDPTSHNLWPFEVLIAAAVALAALGLLVLGERSSRRRQPLNQR